MITILWFQYAGTEVQPIQPPQNKYTHLFFYKLEPLNINIHLNIYIYNNLEDSNLCILLKVFARPTVYLNFYNKDKTENQMDLKSHFQVKGLFINI